MGRGGEGFQRALRLHLSGNLSEAAAIYRELLASGDPHTPDAAINLGSILHEERRFDEALAQYRQALLSRPDDPRALNNLGNSLMALGRFAEAAESYRLALRGAPDCLEARLGLGAALQKEGKVTAAIACFRKILEREPAHAEAHWNLSLALLLSGDFREGWREYEWRWRKDSFTSPRRSFAEPLWDGSPLAGRSILVHAEQGLGDTLQFARYLPMVAASGGRVWAECQSPSLRPLLERISGVAAVFVMGEALPPFDLQIPLLSLPRVFDTTVETIPARIPYMEPDPGRLSLWGERVGRSAELKVGLVWAGKAAPDPFRSCTPEALAPLKEIPCISFYSLQLGEPLPSLAGWELVDLTAEIHDFADTAALISHLDLVISVDTSVAHLAAALGKPVWLMLPKAGDYRWLMERLPLVSVPAHIPPAAPGGMGRRGAKDGRGTGCRRVDLPRAGGGAGSLQRLAAPALR